MLKKVYSYAGMLKKIADRGYLAVNTVFYALGSRPWLCVVVFGREIGLIFVGGWGWNEMGWLQLWQNYKEEGMWFGVGDVRIFGVGTEAIKLSNVGKYKIEEMKENRINLEEVSLPSFDTWHDNQYKPNISLPPTSLTLFDWHSSKSQNNHILYYPFFFANRSFRCS